jgi:hypothetical protein
LCWTESEEKSGTDRRTMMLEIVQHNWHKDFLKNFPQCTQLYNEIESHFMDHVHKLQTIYNSLPKDDKKAFAVGVSRYKWKKFLFEMFALSITNVVEYPSFLPFTDIRVTLARYMSAISITKLLELMSCNI